LQINWNLFTLYDCMKEKKLHIQTQSLIYVNKHVKCIYLFLYLYFISDSGTFLGLGTITGSVAIYIAFSLQVRTCFKLTSS